MMEGQGQIQGTSLRSVAPKKATRPTPDQNYLMTRLNDSWSASLSLPAIQKLNTAHGVAAVTSAMRELHGFPPEEAIRSPYAYLASMLENAETA